MTSKKVVLFIVEGINDKVALGEIIKSLFKDTNIFFQISDGDITTNNLTTLTNVINQIYEQVKIAQKETHYDDSDIIQIIHLVDTDGAFINENQIVFHKENNICYTGSNIKTQYVESLRKRNKKKSLLLNKLYTKKDINGIPYKIFYFSCNLEHVLHNIQNASKEEKEKLADEFADRFYLKATDFIDFINNSELTTSTDFVQSWEFIKQGSNSLNRYTNFNLCLTEIQKIIDKIKTAPDN